MYRVLIWSISSLLLTLTITPAIAATAEIHDAVRSGDLAAVTSFIDQNAESLNDRDDKGKTPLHYALESNKSEIAEYLIGRGADINLADDENRSPLHYAALLGNLEIAGLLLEKGAATLNDTSAVKHGGFVGRWMPLHLACLHGHPETADLLLENGADIEARDGIERTPLILSVESKDMRVVELLVTRGADINAQALRGYTALLWAARNDFEEMVDYLIGRGATIETDKLTLAFQLAVINGLSGLYEYVLGQGFAVAEVKDKDADLIFPAAAGGSTEIMASLAGHGFDLTETDENGWTTLHHAASEGQMSMIDYLIAQGVDKNARNAKGESAFNLALAQGHAEIADYLKANGADFSEPQFPLLKGPYMGQKPPGDTPEMFLPGIVSGNFRAHSSIAFSPDGKEAYWTEMAPPEGAVRVSRIENGRWTYPVMASVDRDPSFSPDGNRLYFIKIRPFRQGEEPGGDPDVKEEYWYLEKTDTGWSDPISTGEAVNAIGVHWPCSVDKDGNLYFSEFAKNMYCSRYVDGEYQKPVLLTEYFNNQTLIGRSPFISPDGDYLIFSSKDGLSISFKRQDGSWTDRINLGDIINASGENGSPRISPDGKYMFFLSAGKGRPWGIYWVSAQFIDRLRAEHAAGK